LYPVPTAVLKKKDAVGQQTTNGALFDKFSKGNLHLRIISQVDRPFKKKYGM
jgi:hypothetical protein